MGGKGRSKQQGGQLHGRRRAELEAGCNWKRRCLRVQWLDPEAAPSSRVWRVDAPKTKGSKHEMMGRWLASPPHTESQETVRPELEAAGRTRHVGPAACPRGAAGGGRRGGSAGRGGCWPTQAMRIEMLWEYSGLCAHARHPPAGQLSRGTHSSSSWTHTHSHTPWHPAGQLSSDTHVPLLLGRC